MESVLFADNQVIIADSEDNLQRGVFMWQNIAKYFGMETSPEKIWDVSIFRTGANKI
jgi:hypothetical protein